MKLPCLWCCHCLQVYTLNGKHRWPLLYQQQIISGKLEDSGIYLNKWQHTKRNQIKWHEVNSKNLVLVSLLLVVGGRCLRVKCWRDISPWWSGWLNNLNTRKLSHWTSWNKPFMGYARVKMFKCCWILTLSNLRACAGDVTFRCWESNQFYMYGTEYRLYNQLSVYVSCNILVFGQPSPQPNQEIGPKLVGTQ